MRSLEAGEMTGPLYEVRMRYANIGTNNSQVDILLEPPTHLQFLCKIDEVG